MSKLDVLLVALVLVGAASGIVISAMIVISVLMVLKPITWVVLGLGALLTIMIAIGIYLFEKHYLN
ncbi:hypothetical protein FDI48_gp50 [Enterococcus phage phiSHEF2]|jgi:hypothetical protein|uniref:Uncharacterized protein n=2 Tax=Efquatrovirus TaxID=2560124 RepID=A0A249XUA9_9CAUD|nr:hypothetical protein FDI48_gp50 [Enterococcus phage phiSHEF2]YP_009625895.1 hypothetical protein FDJ59_gp39 [Enterococcus phage AUEF3]AHN83305.1 putative membrane protein [Enterococcus phage AUEF3]ASZ75575.1 hypothetical protein phiSHEF2_50 [Enterococcus phage phiSHEF2]